MAPLKKEQIKQEVFDLYDKYAHNQLDRREFMEKLSVYAVGGITMASLMSFVMPNYKDTLTVSPNDPELDSKFITYNSPKGGGDIKGLLSKQKNSIWRSNGKVGVVGFCFGGWISNMMAVRVPDLAAAVPFYGSQPADDEVAQINAPLLIHYAGLDERVNAGWEDYEAKLKELGKDYEAHFYPDVNHGFHNNTTPRFDEASADLAWKRTIEFFKEHLS